MHMKLEIVIDKEREEKVFICAHEKTRLVQEIEQLVHDNAFELIGYREKNAVKLNPNDVDCFITEDNKVFAISQSEKLQLKCRLYQLEENLSDGFVKINQSCIANIKRIERFQASVGGSLTVVFKNGYTDYVSRRNLKNVKERLGL